VAAAPVTATAGHSAVLDADLQPAGLAVGQQIAEPQAAIRAPASRRATAPAQPAAYKVRPGDSLSSIARHLYHDPADWTVLYWGNRRQIHWADDISAGQVLRVPAKPARTPAAPGELRAPAPVIAAVSPAAAPAAVTGTGVVRTADTSYSGSAPGGSFGACVIARESGGNAQVMNATGHYGLYQFSASTWAAYGGNPADFGDASVAEQNQVFANALAAGGESNWAPYDGC
jgi:LysM repeat protein